MKRLKVRQGQLFPETNYTLPDAELDYQPGFFARNEADNALRQLLALNDWRQDHIRLYGREVAIPRLQAWYGDADASYTYSGLKMQPLPWNDLLFELKERLQQHLHRRFNSVLANCYRNGQDAMGWHADNEPELGPDPVIASVSFGATRAMDFRHNITRDKVRFELEHGSLLVMRGRTQEYWQHAIPRRLKVARPRVNLTFRCIKKQL